MSNYKKIILNNLSSLYNNLPENLEKALPALKKGNLFYFRAFGEDCCLGPENITLSGRPDDGPRGLLISLYATHARPGFLQLEPFKSFRELPDSMPYQGAFTVNAEQALVTYVPRIKKDQKSIIKAFGGIKDPAGITGDFSFLLYPLPKIALCYIFFMPDEEFPASVTCLFSANAFSFMPLDGLADVAEYTSKGIIHLID